MPLPSIPTAPARSEGRVAIAYVQPILELLHERSCDLAALAGMAGLPGNWLDTAPDSISTGTYLRLLDSGAALCNDPHFGLHAGERFRLGTYNVYGMILMCCKNFGQAFQQTMRYEGLAHDLGRSSLDIRGEIAQYQWHSHFPDASRHLVESVFAGIRVFGQWFAGTDLPPVPVYFSHAAPDDLSEHHRLFGELVYFDAPMNHASLPSDLLSWPVPNADASMYPVLQQHAELLLLQKQQAAQREDIVSQVRSVILRHLAQDQARLADIAVELNMSQRTLQRKLTQAGIPYQQLLDQTRQSLAENYLRQHHLSLAEIAFLLGYQEQSAFQHAFREWTGVTPRAFRSKPDK
ncbi:AraC family transcriptional regulator [Undibacterium oligocarboniphilum]|uniref:AraC family transcriptional regulator n=1 Tax=Undibacterium oligocarboniphilum TaxID=666702 RepID=A0A850QBB6_9BURK|nr:AraC family transcriptional regulator [Undibacterium oligocarboniphilum]MBC3868891.1 AraC family transcriptional regulator [Undibacterium oligocarboniphilum]NVO76871.1 AraC family transcriptional regulator [Undibacterium oligocarboniphilum]